MIENKQAISSAVRDEALVEMLRGTNDTNNLEALFTVMQPSDPVEGMTRRS